MNPCGCSPTAENYQHYQTIVLNDYKLGTLKRSAAKFLNEQTLEDAEDCYKTYIDLQDFGKTGQKSKRETLIEVYQEMVEDQGEISGIDTGFCLLNSIKCGRNF